MKKMISTIVSLFFMSLLFLPASSFAFNVGDKAPAFTAQSTQGEISLSAYAGKKNVVLALYFAVFTSVWASELANFQRDLEEFEKLDAQIVGVSNDDMKSLEQFVKEEQISFPLVTDSQKDIKRNYGSGRITYLIDKQGIIRFIQKGVPDNDDFIKQLEMIQ